MAKTPSLNAGESPLTELHIDQFRSGNLRFPLEYENPEGNHFITFRAFRYSRIAKTSKGSKIQKAIIKLPIPSNLTDGWKANYSNLTLGSFGGQVEKELGGAGTAAIAAALGKGDLGSLSLKDGVGWRLLKAGGVAAIRNSAQALGAKLNLDVVGTAEVVAGAAINPHIATTFEGVDFKQHSFSYKLSARSKPESEMISTIIDAFKFHMLPSLSASGSVFDFPDEWQIQFSKDIIQHLYTFRPCILRSFNVSYNGQGTPVFFKDGKAPVDIDIELGFEEVEIATKETILQSFQERGLNLAAEKQAADEAAAIISG